MRKLSLVLAGVALASAASAQAPLNPPQQVKTRIGQLDAQCRQAGGQPVARPYVFVYDFTGDRVVDYLISEGDYGCNGKPDLFRKNGAAFVEIWVAQPGGAGAMMFRENVRGYRIVDGAPRVVQLVRFGAACGQGAAPAAVCPAILAWDFIGRKFSTAGAPVVAAGPAGPPPKAGPPQSAASAPLASAGPALGPPETRAQFEARCKAEWMVKFPGEQFRPGNCDGVWDQAVAAGPAADVLLALGGPGQDVASVKAKAKGVVWSARPRGGELASGRMGKWEVSLMGRGAVEEAVFRWGAVGDFSPFDVAQAMKARRVRMSEVACLEYGAVESTQVFAVQPAGGLTIYDRGAAVASASAEYAATWSMRGQAPSLAALRRMPGGEEWKARCEY